MPDDSAPKVHAERITIYDSVHIPPGTRVPEQITFSFGADCDEAVEEKLSALGESEIIDRLLANATLSERLMNLVGGEYPNCWIITEILTRDVSRSWPHSKPGDLDIVCGNMRDGKPELGFIACVQVKIRKVKDLDDTGAFASGAGTMQAHFTARMGFDRTLLLHCIVRAPQPTPEGYAPSWNSIINAHFERAAKSCYGTIRERFQKGRELYGFGWIGWGQAYGKRWQTCGGFAVDLVYPPPNRPTLDSAEAVRTRAEVVNSLRGLLARSPSSTLPLIVRCRGKDLLGEHG